MDNTVYPGVQIDCSIGFSIFTTVKLLQISSLSQHLM